VAGVLARRLVAALASGALVAACGTNQTASPTPSSIPGASDGVSAAPTQEPSATVPVQSTASPAQTDVPQPTRTAVAYPRELDFTSQLAMRVTVAELNVRASPSPTGTKAGIAKKGAVFLVEDWPIRAGGFTWYFGRQAVLPADGSIPKLPDPLASGIDPLSGWLAIGTESDPYLQPIAPRCPTNPDLRYFGGMLDSELLACFGASSLEIEGTYGCNGCGGVSNPGTYSPRWLADSVNYDFLSVNPEESNGPLTLHLAPGIPALPAQGTILSVQGHFDDPIAKSCAIAVPPPGNPDGAIKSIDARAAITYCRTQFVVEYFEVLGTDPSFGTG
jgi:hypothetical protein